MREHVEQWLAHMEHVRQASPNTIRAYRADLRGLEVITRPAIRRFLAAQHGEVSGATMARRLHAIRSFGDWLLVRGVIADNPARSIRLPKGRSRVPRTLTVDESFGVLAAFGRREWQRRMLSRVDHLINPLFRENSRYLVYGYARK